MSILFIGAIFLLFLFFDSSQYLASGAFKPSSSSPPPSPPNTEPQPQQPPQVPTAEIPPAPSSISSLGLNETRNVSKDSALQPSFLTFKSSELAFSVMYPKEFQVIDNREFVEIRNNRYAEPFLYFSIKRYPSFGDSIDEITENTIRYHEEDDKKDDFELIDSRERGWKVSTKRNI